MNVIVICEFSGLVRDAFIRQGHNAISCDLLPSESSFGPHIIGDCRLVDYTKYNLVIAHPPCTHLSSSGAAHFYKKEQEQKESLDFVRWILKLPVERICLENPVGIISTNIRKYSQLIQPWQFGHGETKSTCLWLKNLPALKATNLVGGREARVHKEPPSKDRWKNRSRTYTGIADAMAIQWSNLPSPEEWKLEVLKAFNAN